MGLKNNNFWICQTFWTKPMSQDKIKTNLELAYISLYYAHKTGYKVRMHTDSEGYELLKFYGYDELTKLLDEIPKDIPSKFFAYSKYMALLYEDVGIIHTDFDVFIKKDCIHKFYEEKTYDCILQNREHQNSIYNNLYSTAKNFFKDDCLYEFLYKHINISNVGVIGFNSKKLKKLYLNNYKKMVNYYKSKSSIMNFVPDLIFEQVHIDYLIYRYNFKPLYLLPEGLEYGSKVLDEYADFIGYQHVLGEWKHKEEGKRFIHEFYEKIKQYNYGTIR